jgi:hypothetical protein
MANSASARQGGASGGAYVFSIRSRWRRSAAVVAIVISGATLSGCAHWMAENANINGAQQLSVNDAATRRVNLPALIVAASPTTQDGTLTNFQSFCPDEYAKGEKGSDANGNKVVETPEPARGRLCLERATQIFNADPVHQVRRRNDIQARLMAASDAECAQFVQHLNSLQGYGNLATGSLTTIFSGAGAIVTGVNAARAFAGLGAITSGLRAEFNSDLFLQQAAPTIGKAIDQQRARFAVTIASSRALDIRDYPLWTAIGDAFKYNDQCSLVKGLAAMDKALEVAANPGLDNMEDYWLRFNRVRYLSQNPQVINRLSLDGIATAPGAAGAAASTAGVGTSPYTLSVVYQAGVGATFAGEQQVIAVLDGASPKPDLKKTGQCQAVDTASTKLSDNAAEWADCLRREAMFKLETCVGSTLPKQYADLSTKDALVSRASAAGAASAELASASFDRDQLLLTAKAQADWVNVVQGYAAGAFASAQGYAREAKMAADAGNASEHDKQMKLARDALKAAVAAVSSTQCLKTP